MLADKSTTQEELVIHEKAESPISMRLGPVLIEERAVEEKADLPMVSRVSKGKLASALQSEKQPSPTLRKVPEVVTDSRTQH